MVVFYERVPSEPPSTQACSTPGFPPHSRGMVIYVPTYGVVIEVKHDQLAQLRNDDPKYFKQMISKSKKFDYVITSRFKKPNLLKGWPLSRKILTYLRHFIVKFFLGINFDASGAYRCFIVKKIRLQDILSSKNNDYAFFWELTYNLHKTHYTRVSRG